MSKVCSVLFATTLSLACFCASSALAAMSITFENPLTFNLVNDGVGPAHFEISSAAPGGAVTARLFDGTHVTTVDGVLSFTGALQGDAVFSNFAGFVDSITETLGHAAIEFRDHDGDVVFARSGAWGGELRRTRNLYFPGADTRLATTVTASSVGFDSAYGPELGLAHTHYLTHFSLLGHGAPGDIGHIENGSMSSASLALQGVRIFVGVPEPATWSLLIAGFGLAGAGLRRRRAMA